MKPLHELEKDYRKLNTELIEDYENSVKFFKEAERSNAKMREEKHNQKKKIFEKAGFDIDAIEKLEAEDAEGFYKNIESRRSELINRKSHFSSEIQSRSFYTGLLSESKQKVMHPFGTCIMSPEQKLVEAIEGERGNPWVFPYDPSQVKIMDSGSVDVWCFEAYGTTPAPVANVWFYFVPDTTRLWEFSAILAFHGFYVLRSYDHWYNCKTAWVKLTASARVWQYSWQGSTTYTLLSKEESNADYTSSFDSTEWLDTKAVLRAGDGAWVLVTVKVEAMGEGSGTYAELNFQTGTANYILPVLLVAWG
jgi:hypothetical protein